MKEDDSTHVCSICGDSSEHTIGYSNGTKANHTEKCSKCDYEATVEHTLVVKDGSYNTSETHTIWCKNCEYWEDEAHTDEIQVQESDWDEATHNVKCTKCQAEYKKEHKFDQPGNKCLCGYTQEEKEPVWELVTSASKAIAVGDRIVIVASTADMAMCTTQKTNNRDGVAITKNAETKTVTITKDVQVITIEQGNKDGTFALTVGTKQYLRGAGTSSSTLKTSGTLDDQASWTIEIDTDGIATVKSSGTNARNWLRYNSSSGNNLFNCYESGYNAIQIYRYTGSGEIVYPGEPSEPGGGGDSGGGGTGGTAGAKWVLLTDVGDLNNGDKIIFVSPDKKYAAGDIIDPSGSKHRMKGVDVSGVVANNQILAESLPEDVLQFTASTSDNKVTWEFTCSAGKLGITGASSNSTMSLTDGTTTWTLSNSGTEHQVQIQSTISGNGSNKLLKYNSGSEWFANYGTMDDPLIYVYQAA